MDGYFLNNNSACIACPFGCSTCTSSTSCSIYKSITNMVSVFLLNSSQIAGACDPGCLTCSSQNPSLCIACFNGYALLT